MTGYEKLLRAVVGDRLYGTDPQIDAGKLKDAIQEILEDLRDSSNRRGGVGARVISIMTLRFGLGQEQGMTLREVAKCQDVTPERIRQIEAKTLRMMRHPMHSRRLKELIISKEEG